MFNIDLFADKKSGNSKRSLSAFFFEVYVNLEKVCFTKFVELLKNK